VDPAIDATLRAALALLFGAAVLHKVRDLGRFRTTLGGYRLLPAPFVPAAALAVVAIESGIAVALASGRPRGFGALGAASLLALYGAAIAVNLARGRRDLECGCAAAGRAISGRLVARNAVLAALALAGAVPLRPRPLVWVDALTVVGAVAVLAAAWAALERLHAAARLAAPIREEA
jgi:hypothetical protein